MRVNIPVPVPVKQVVSLDHNDLFYGYAAFRELDDSNIPWFIEIATQYEEHLKETPYYEDSEAYARKEAKLDTFSKLVLIKYERYFG